MSEPIAWESTTVVFKRFLTETQYQRLRPSYRRWYRPYRCACCTALTSPLALDGREGE